MSKGIQRLALPFLLALGLALSGSPAGAAARLPPAATQSVGWLSKFFVHLSSALGKNGYSVDPNGGSDLNKSGIAVDPNGRPNPNKSGFQVDPNGGGSPKP